MTSTGNELARRAVPAGQPDQGSATIDPARSIAPPAQGRRLRRRIRDRHGRGARGPTIDGTEPSSSRPLPARARRLTAAARFDALVIGAVTTIEAGL
ncbi:MAG: hypothetical protein ACRCYU_08305, partial [Nocardioides sp.]